MSSHADPNNSSRAYTGPTVSEMITTHTLAQNIIKYHDHPTSDQILDDSELDLLKCFVNNPDERDQILKDHSLAENVSWASPALTARSRKHIAAYDLCAPANHATT